MTALEEVKAIMKEMLDKKAEDLDRIQQLQQEARTKIEAAGLAMKHATENLDIEAYEEARQAKAKAQTALDVYNGRFRQIAEKEFVTEEESDRVINSLLEYENTLAESFKLAAGETLKTLADLYKCYKDEVAETESTLSQWQRDIHANYLSSMTLYYDPVTGNRTHRSPRPIPVRSAPYLGCEEARELGEYLNKAEALYNGI